MVPLWLCNCCCHCRWQVTYTHIHILIRKTKTRQKNSSNNNIIIWWVFADCIIQYCHMFVWHRIVCIYISYICVCTVYIISYLTHIPPSSLFRSLCRTRSHGLAAFKISRSFGESRKKNFLCLFVDFIFILYIVYTHMFAWQILFMRYLLNDSTYLSIVANTFHFFLCHVENLLREHIRKTNACSSTQSHSHTLRIAIQTTH